MHVNWLVTIVLSLSFIGLIWLLKRFFYQPIIDDLISREQSLKQRLCVANDKMNQAKILQYSCEKEYQAFAKQRVSLLKKSQDEANKTSLKLLKSAHEAADDMLLKRLGAIQNELQKLQKRVIKQNISEVYGIAEKMLADLMGVELHGVMVDKFIDLVNSLPKQQRMSLLSALRRANNLVVIRSAYALSEQEKQKISQSFSTLLANSYPIVIKFNFIVVPDFIAGLEINVSGWKLAWSIKQHLQTLHENVSNALQLDPLLEFAKFKSGIVSFVAPEHTKSVEI